MSPDADRVHRTWAEVSENPVPDAERGNRGASSPLAMFSRERRPFPGFQNRGEVRASAFALPLETVA